MKKFLMLAALLILFRSGLNERNTVSKSAYLDTTVSDSKPSSMSFDFEEDSVSISFKFEFCSEDIATFVICDFLENPNSKKKKKKINK